MRLLVPLLALISCAGCPHFGPRRLSAMKDLTLDANVPLDTTLVNVLLRCDWDASGGCADLGTDFHATLNGDAVLATTYGTITETGSCGAPSVGAVAPAGATLLQFVIADSSKTVEFDVENPFTAQVAVTRCAGAVRCVFAGPLGTATLVGTP